MRVSWSLLLALGLAACPDPSLDNPGPADASCATASAELLTPTDGPDGGAPILLVVDGAPWNAVERFELEPEVDGARGGGIAVDDGRSYKWVLPQADLGPRTFRWICREGGEDHVLLEERIDFASSSFPLSASSTGDACLNHSAELVDVTAQGQVIVEYDETPAYPFLFAVDAEGNHPATSPAALHTDGVAALIDLESGGTYDVYAGAACPDAGNFPDEAVDVIEVEVP